MIVGAENIKQWLVANRLRWWKIRYAGKDGNVVFEYTPEMNNESTTAEALFELDKTLCILGGGSYVVQGWNDTSNQKNHKYAQFDHVRGHGSGIAGIGATQQVHAPQISAEELDQKISAGIEAYKREVEHKQVVDELARLRDELKAVDDRWLRVFEKLTPYAEPLIGAITKMISPTISPAAAVAGTNDVQKKKVTQQTQVQQNNELEMNEQRVIAALEKWQANEPDFLTVLEKIAEMSENNKAMYNMAKNALMAQ